MDKDESGNVTRGVGEVIFASTQNSFAYSDQAYVALLGVRDMMVVVTVTTPSIGSW